jgi:hypothetical protein
MPGRNTRYSERSPRRPVSQDCCDHNDHQNRHDHRDVAIAACRELTLELHLLLLGVFHVLISVAAYSFI